MKGHIAPLGPNKWRVFYDVPPGPDGKRQLRSKRITGSKKDAEVELRKLLSEVDNGTYVQDLNARTGEHLYRWLEHYAKNRVTAKTFERYEDIVRSHLVPRFGAIPLAKLKPQHIQAYYSDALASGRLDGRGGLSGRSVLQHHRILRKALSQAVRWGMMSVNPADMVDPPKAKKAERGIISERQVALLLTECKDTEYYIPVLIAVTTGMRRSEVCGLRWQDVDFENKRLTVIQAMEQSRSGIKIVKPKTESAVRMIDLSDSVIRALIRHKGKQAEHKLLLGSAWKETGLVCSRDDGDCIHPDSFTQWFTRAASRLDLRITLHGLRHTHASQLMRDGVHMKVVSERLGHARVGFTLETYTHLIPSQQREAADQLDTYMRRVMGE